MTCLRSGDKGFLCTCLSCLGHPSALILPSSKLGCLLIPFPWYCSFAHMISSAWLHTLRSVCNAVPFRKPFLIC